jgi:hypothetical protein
VPNLSSLYQTLGSSHPAIFPAVRYIQCVHILTLSPRFDPLNTVIIIGLGGVSPIKAYIELTSAQYPLYTDPGLELHRIFGFITSVDMNEPGKEKEYEKGLGGRWARIWSGMKAGPMKNISHLSSVGPTAQNGGELILDKG